MGPRDNMTEPQGLFPRPWPWRAVVDMWWNGAKEAEDPRWGKLWVPEPLTPSPVGSAFLTTSSPTAEGWEVCLFLGGHTCSAQD